MSDKVVDVLLELYRRHLYAAQEDMGSAYRKRLYDLIDEMELEFPEAKSKINKLYPTE